MEFKTLPIQASDIVRHFADNDLMTAPTVVANVIIDSLSVKMNDEFINCKAAYFSKEATKQLKDAISMNLNKIWGALYQQVLHYFHTTSMPDVEFSVRAAKQKVYRALDLTAVIPDIDFIIVNGVKEACDQAIRNYAGVAKLDAIHLTQFIKKAASRVDAIAMETSSAVRKVLDETIESLD